MTPLAHLRARLDDVEARPAVIAVAVWLVASIAALIFGWAATPFITLAALAYGQAAYREARTAVAQMAANVNGIHRAGSDAHRALGALKGLEAAASARYLPSTGKHGEAVTREASPAPRPPT